MEIVAVTASVGEDSVRAAMLSVQTQTVSPVQHLVVFDGSEIQSQQIRRMSDEISSLSVDRQIVATGRRLGDQVSVGWRAYVAALRDYVSPEAYVAFLDADNIWLRNHVSALQDTLLNNTNASAAGSLRYVWDPGSPFLLPDIGESIGTRPRAMYHWARQGLLPAELSDFYLAHPNLVDTSSLMIRCGRLLDFADIVVAERGDARLTSALVRGDELADCPLLSMVYRLGSARSGTLDHFRSANRLAASCEETS